MNYTFFTYIRFVIQQKFHVYFERYLTTLEIGKLHYLSSLKKNLQISILTDISLKIQEKYDNILKIHKG